MRWRRGFSAGRSTRSIFSSSVCHGAHRARISPLDCRHRADITASLVTRPVGAFLFGLLADRYGRRLPLMLDIVFYSVVEVLSGLAPSYAVFLSLRLLYGIGMGGEWGVGASLAMESVPAKWRGVLSGLSAGRLRARAICWPRWRTG